MKVLIWIGCFILQYICAEITDSIGSSILNLGIVVGNHGALLYGTIIALVKVAFLALAFWSAVRLCKKLDWYRAKKKAAKAGMTVTEYGKQGLSAEFLEKLASLCEKRPIEEVESQLKACVKKGMITKEQYIILLKEYTTTK